MAQRGRSPLLVGAVLAAAVMMVSSSAWACAVFKGKMVVQGNRSTNVVTAIGKATTGMTWCSGYPMGRAKATLGGSVTVTMSKNPVDACLPGLKLDAGTYQVNYANGAAHRRSDPADKNNKDGSRAWVIDCASPVNPLNTTVLGTMSIDSNGTGTGTYTLPSTGVVSGPTDEAAVCVSDVSGNNGNQAPVAIL